MKITKENVAHIAKLARLNIPEGELDQYADKLSSILAYVEQLNQVDTENVETTAQVTGLENIMREDGVLEVDTETKQKLVASAPHTENNLIKTKSVF